MSWPTKSLTAADLAACVELTEVAREELISEIPAWPQGSCSDTCCVLLPLLRDRLGNHAHRFRITRGWFDSEELGVWEAPHTWIQTARGWIIDPTAGQFFGGGALRVFSPTAAEAEFYLRKLC